MSHHHGGHKHGHGDGPLMHRFENAADWAKIFDDPEREAWQRPADVVALLGIAPGMTVAEIGPGTGYFARHLSRAVGARGRVLAVDAEDSMLAYIRDRAAREGLENLTVWKGSFGDPGLDPGSVDRVLIVNTWHHIAAREEYAAKLRRSLVPGGFVAVVDFTLEATHGPSREHRLAAEQVQRELKGGGLEATIADAPLPEQYVVIGRRSK